MRTMIFVTSAVLSLATSAFAQPVRDEGGFLNLRGSRVFLSGDAGPFRPEEQPISGRAEFLQAGKDWLFEASAESREYDRSVVQRGDTRWIYRSPEGGWRLTAGDLNIVRRGFQTSPFLGGLSVRKGGPAQPERTAVRIGDRRLLVRRLSLVEVSYDGMVVSRGVVAAGELDLGADPLLQNPGPLTVRVRDDLGQEEVFRFDHGADMGLVAAGESEFSYNVGSPWRASGGDRAYDGQGAFTTLWHRYGVNERWTIGFNYQNWFYRHLYGAEISTVAGSGLFSFEAAGSAVIGVQGAAGRARWESGDGVFGAPGWRLRAGYERRGETFFPVTVGPATPETWSGRGDLMVSKSFGRVAAGLGGVVEQPFGPGKNRVVPQGNLDFILGGGARLQANYMQVQDAGVREERAVIAFQWSEALPRLSVSSAYDDRNRERWLSLRRDNDNETRDVRARVTDGRRSGGPFSDAQVDAFTGPAVVRFDHFDRTDFGTRARRAVVGVDTGISWGSRGVTVGAPVKEGFQGE